MNLIDSYSQIGLTLRGLLIKQIGLFSGSSGFSMIITPTAASSRFCILSIHWLLDTGLASGGTSVSAQINYFYNGSIRIGWTSIFSELIDNFMDDDSFYFTPNGTNYIQFTVSLGTLNIANGYLIFKGFYG